MKKEYSLKLEEERQFCEGLLKTFLPKEEGLQRQVIAAMEYSLLAGGKRIRPILMKASFDFFSKGGQEERRPLLHAFMAAMEMIHSFSLVHDDLPCMDNDKFRRGRESTWYHFSEEMAVLSGDALILYAFSTLSKAFSEHIVSERGKKLSDAAFSEHALAFHRALSMLSECSGIYGMLGGQVVDVERTGKVLNEEELSFIYSLKTAALIAGSLSIGAALAGASPEDALEIKSIGEDIGIAFQIQDDILDETSTEEELGKPIHSDRENGKTTYVSLYGIEKAGLSVEEHSKRAIDKLTQIAKRDDLDQGFLLYIIESLIHRRK